MPSYRDAYFAGYLSVLNAEERIERDLDDAQDLDLFVSLHVPTDGPTLAA